MKVFLEVVNENHKVLFYPGKIFLKGYRKRSIIKLLLHRHIYVKISPERTAELKLIKVWWWA